MNSFVVDEVTRIDLGVVDARLAVDCVIGRLGGSAPVDVSWCNLCEARRSDFFAVDSVTKRGLVVYVPTVSGCYQDLVCEQSLDDPASFDALTVEEMRLCSDDLPDGRLDVGVVTDDERRYDGSLCGWALDRRPPLGHGDCDMAMRLCDLGMAVHSVGYYAHSPRLLNDLSPHEVVSSTLLSRGEEGV